MRSYLAERNQNPKHHVCNAKGEESPRKIQRARAAAAQASGAA